MKDCISISSRLMLQIEQYCIAHLPYEACGLLLGSEAKPQSEMPLFVRRFVGIPNTAANPRRHFVMDPSVFIPYLFVPNPCHESIIGIVHSHPSAPPVPSLEDLQTSWIDVPSHWIVSLQNADQPEWQAYRYEKLHPNESGSLTRSKPLRLITTT